MGVGADAADPAGTAVRLRVGHGRASSLHAPCRAASFALALAFLAMPRLAAADPVTGWTSPADLSGTEAANRHTPAVMHRAMHDAGDAAAPL